MLLNKLQIIVSSTRINRRINVLISVRRFCYAVQIDSICAKVLYNLYSAYTLFTIKCFSNIKHFNIKLNIFIKIIIRDDYKSTLKFGF